MIRYFNLSDSCMLSFRDYALAWTKTIQFKVHVLHMRRAKSQPKVISKYDFGNRFNAVVLCLELDIKYLTNYATFPFYFLVFFEFCSRKQRNWVRGRLLGGGMRANGYVMMIRTINYQVSISSLIIMYFHGQSILWSLSCAARMLCDNLNDVSK
jgi:hypothetical protein